MPTKGRGRAVGKASSAEHPAMRVHDRGQSLLVNHAERRISHVLTIPSVTMRDRIVVTGRSVMPRLRRSR